MNFAARNKPGIDRTQHQRRRKGATGWITPLLVGLLCAGLLVASYNHERGNFHRLRTAVIKPEDPPKVHASPGPGGQHALELVRSATSLGSYPEFLSVTLLPGRGLQVLQITAVVPPKGEIQLLHAPTMEAATQQLSGTGEDANGQRSTTFGGAFLAPWAGVLTGNAGSAPGRLETSWQGHKIVVPAAFRRGDAHEGVRSTEGLLVNRGADSVQTGVLSDGQWAEAVFRAGNFGGAWPSSLELTGRVELSSHTVDLTLTGRNAGNTAMPLGLGWKPYFAIPSRDRANARLLVPSASELRRNERTGLPSGGIQPVANTDRYFGRPGGTQLGSADIDGTYVDLQHPLVSDGPSLELLDAGSDYGLRMTLLSASITSVHVTAPSHGSWVSLETDTNASDPFGRQWGSEGSGIRVLQPGESLTWKVRLEIFSVSTSHE